MNARVPILAYHQITDTIPPYPGAQFSVPVGNFEAQMAYLREAGYRCLSLDDLLTTDGTSPKVFVLTFDDGYLDFYTTAYPILQRFGYTATVFLVSTYVGGRSVWEYDTAEHRPLMTWDQIRTLHQQGITFGSHTCTHPRLTDVSAEQVRHELVHSKAQLEDHLGGEVRWLAYPFAAHSPEIRAAAAQAGYSGACGGHRDGRGLFDLQRRMCLTNDTLARFAHKISTRYHAWWRLHRTVREHPFLRPIIQQLRKRA